MAARNGETDPDALALDPSLRRPVAGLTVKLYSTDAFTYYEIWQLGLEQAPAGVRVFFQRWPRRLDAQPDVYTQAAWLARRVAGSDREGWEPLRF